MAKKKVAAPKRPAIKGDSISARATRVMLRTPVPVSPHVDVEDRRQYHPSRAVRPARLVSGLPARITRTFNKKFDIPKFADASRVLVCIRRKSRREVMFAKKLYRKGAGGAKHRNYMSEVSCG